MFRGVLLVGLLFVVLLEEGSGTYPERVLLRDIQVITLHQGKYTNARRSSPIPQLKCVGGTADCYAFTPKVVQCYNRGSDGYDVQWECKTEMEKAYRFGELEVSCEGFDFADDPYVLKGSCGLEYKLDLTGVGSHQTNDNYYSKSKQGSAVVTLVLVVVACIVIYKAYQWLSAQQQQQQQQTTGGYSSSYSGPNAHTYSSPHNTGTGGFWTGAATGGVLGYLFGSRNNAGYQRQPNYSGYGSSGSGFGSGWGSSAYRGSGTTSSGSDTRTTSGFGGTKRR